MTTENDRDWEAYVAEESDRLEEMAAKARKLGLVPGCNKLPALNEDGSLAGKTKEP